MNNQELFDELTAHLLRQGEPAFDPTLGKKAYAFDGKYSAIGFYLRHINHKGNALGNIKFIDPEDLKQGLLLPHRDLLLALEHVHDHSRPDGWSSQFHAVAKQFGLEFDEVNYSTEAVYEHEFRLFFTVRSNHSNPVQVPNSLIADEIIKNAVAENTHHVETRRVEIDYYLVKVDFRLMDNNGVMAQLPVKAYSEEEAFEKIKHDVEVRPSGERCATTLSAKKVDKVVYDALAGESA